MKIKIISAPNQKAFGGDLQSNGATWDNGLTYIGAGGSHESNPNEGVQIGVDSQGIPNLVEEGEVLWNDFVFSKRINMPDKDKKLFKLGGNKPMSYADAALKLSEESKERPNDPFSKASLNKMLTLLSESQETLKAQMKQEKARQQFNQMSPEEQMGLMQMVQQQQMMPQTPQNPSIEMMGNPYGNMSAYGGNLFVTGGPKGTYYYNNEDEDEDSFSSKHKGMNPDLDEEDFFTNSGKDPAVNSKLNLNTTEASIKPKKENVSSKTEEKKNRNTKATKSKTGKYNEEWFKARARAAGYNPDNPEFKSFFESFDKNDAQKNLAGYNNAFKEAQINAAKKRYADARRQSYRNKELESGRYKIGDDGKAVYRAKFYDDSDLGKDYINNEGTRIDAETFEALPSEERLAYKKRPVIKGQFSRDYNGNINYDYDTDVSDSWLEGQDFTEGFEMDPRNISQIEYDPVNNKSALSYLRYAPALGSAIGLMTDAFKKPDYSRAQEIKNASSYTAPLINYQPIGNYLRYNPMDINYAQNKLNQEAAATRRALQNTAGTRGAAMAGMLASDYNAQQASGDLFRKALEYNDAQQQKVEDFNRGTNMFNSQQGLTAQRANQAAIQQALRDRYQGILTGNALMDQIDARRAASMSANMTNLFNSLGQIGEEAYDWDRINNAYIQRGILLDPYSNKTACGGMLTKSKRNKGGK